VKTKRKKRPAVHRNAVTRVTLADWAGLFGGQISPKIVKAVGREYAKVKNPTQGAFERCVRAVAARGNAKSPRGVCAAAGRKKYGAPKFKAMAAAGRKRKRPNPARSKAKRKNPVDKAAEVYREFHGREPDEVITITEKVHVHDTLSGVGVLESLTIAAIDGVSMVKLSGFKGALLAQSEDKRQLFIEGGDQSVNLKDFGIEPTKRHEQEVLGTATEIAYETRKDHLGEAGGAGERAIHVHPFGSRRGMAAGDPRKGKANRLPIVFYDVRNRKLAFAGGTYDLPVEGIRG
jgi:hypothetical protein